VAEGGSFEEQEEIVFLFLPRHLWSGRDGASPVSTTESVTLKEYRRLLSRMTWVIAPGFSFAPTCGFRIFSDATQALWAIPYC
jgi:hypothetical protein